MKLLNAIASVCMLLPMAAQCQAWPTKPIKLIVTLPAGTPPDVLARGLARQLEIKLKQPVVVENRPGANNIIGMQACAAAPPDGHTLCVSTNDSVSVNPHLYKRLPYDPDKQIKPVAILAWPNSVIVADSALPAKTFQDVVALSKARPGALSWASFGNGSSSHLYLEWIRSRTGWEVTHVPFQGSPIQPILAGHVQLTYFTIGAETAHRFWKAASSCGCWSQAQPVSP
ncbi:tripartite tricarboxylate transporter substrate binding protein [Polaromonas sp. P1-6]|nr:tripartite tricarboxylate transporter substrate binding protein [Polaromonas sp. P1-6]